MAKIDLTLLASLDALLAERSVTQAAERLGVSQPTMSASLARLRRHFHDELLYRSGNTYNLTALGVHLADRTGVALGADQRIFAAQSGRSPEHSEREFVVVCSDYGAAVIGPPLVAAVAAAAPEVRVHFRQTDPAPFATSQDRLRAVDALMLPHGFLPRLAHIDLFRDTWVCLVAAGNDRVGEELTLADLGQLALVVTGGSSTTVLRSLRQHGVDPRIRVVVDNFLAAPLLVRDSDRVALVPRRLARLGDPDAFRILEPPFDAGPLVQALWWHPDFERDPEHEWLRAQFALVAAQEAS